METILFNFLSYSPGPFWLILLLIPAHKIAMRCFDIYLILLTTIFAMLTIPLVPALLPIIAEPTITGIQQFLSTDTGVVGTWNHMILGDLWIGRWTIHDAVKNRTPFLVRLPVLVTILFFGPLGLFLYLIYRMVVLKKIWIFQPQEVPQTTN